MERGLVVLQILTIATFYGVIQRTMNPGQMLLEEIQVGVMTNFYHILKGMKIIKDPGKIRKV